MSLYNKDILDFETFSFSTPFPHKSHLMSRPNRNLRERVKVQRGWKSYHTSIAEGKRIQYNFVKPHMALEGRTPAETSGIKIEEDIKNKWLALLRNAKK